MQQELSVELLVWILLGISVLTAFLRPYLWLIPLSLSLIGALYLGIVDYISVGIIVAGLLLAYATYRCSIVWLKLLGHILTLGWIAALALHQLPDVNNWLMLDHVVTGSSSIPFSMYLNFDKPLVFFGLLLLFPQLLDQREFYWSKAILTSSQVLTLITGLLTIVALAWLLQLVHLEWSVPSWLWLFVLNNLLFTCVVEEALFRGYIQRQLLNYISPVYAIAITSILFGAAHYAGGIRFIVVATLAGAVYGIAYYWTRKLSIAVLVHFIFNMIHLIFFTYPMAQP
ncbi:CPBP family intramembrane glutamic endopeptidase [Shewanella marina]|uniref:CPBP family intramembrane glutamic endopeptidase n=1 Tax=Shewanella marina TaxID=487319 RepID=UPI00046EE13C|nr:CPBP family intramembrane glutamic endopeptidase [Shewanella marina]